jgi:hypothetical protein
MHQQIDPTRQVGKSAPILQSKLIRQSVDYPFAIYSPFIAENLLTDAIANIPIEQYHFGVYTNSNPGAAGLDK